MFRGMNQDSEVHTPAPRGIALGSTETVIHHLRTHPKVLFLPVLAALACGAAAIAAVIWVPSEYEGLPARLVAAGVTVLAFLWLSVWPWVKWVTNTFTLTSQNLVHSEGLIWRRTHTTRLDRVSDVRSDQGLLDRIFRCGTLVITNAGSGGMDPHAAGSAQMRFRDIPRVKAFEREMSDLAYAPRP